MAFCEFDSGREHFMWYDIWVLGWYVCRICAFALRVSWAWLVTAAVCCCIWYFTRSLDRVFSSGCSAVAGVSSYGFVPSLIPYHDPVGLLSFDSILDTFGVFSITYTTTSSFHPDHRTSDEHQVSKAKHVTDMSSFSRQSSSNQSC